MLSFSKSLITNIIRTASHQQQLLLTLLKRPMEHTLIADKITVYRKNERFPRG